VVGHGLRSRAATPRALTRNCTELTSGLSWLVLLAGSTGVVDRRHREAPTRRIYKSGEIVWVARYTAPDGRRRIAKPAWNRGFGTFSRRRDAQHAIEEAYGLSAEVRSLGEYFATWLERHPRAARTNATYTHRVSRILDVEVEGRLLGQWPLAALRRRHALALVDHLLRVHGRTASGAAAILRALSAMAEDATTDEMAERNPFKGSACAPATPRPKAPAPGARLRLRGNAPLREGGRAHEAMVCVFTDAGERDPGRLVPVPPALAELLAEKIASEGPGEELIFQTPTGKLWRESGFYRSVWGPAREASGIDIRPHECRHRCITHLGRAGGDDADLARIAGHRISTMLARYSHSIGGSFEDVRRAID
jgi:integrase-like protein